MAHTPEKWNYVLYPSGEYTVESDKYVIAERIASKQEAALIASAPALLEALKEMIYWFVPADEDCLSENKGKCLDEARAAIAAAEGE